jgi:uncharacterized paraquat-inducible protein A
MSERHAPPGPGEPIRFPCSHCGAALEVNRGLAGRAVQCPDCNRTSRAPVVSRRRQEKLPRAAFWSVTLLLILAGAIAFYTLVFLVIPYADRTGTSSSNN